MVNNSNHEVHMHQGRFGLSLINSFIGSYLEKENNPLAVEMGFYQRSKMIDLEAPIEEQLDFQLSNKVVIFVHGLSNLENVWSYPPTNQSTTSILSHYVDLCFEKTSREPEQHYGSKLNLDYGYTPLFLRYNTGISLDKNAQRFNRLLNKLFESYPNKIEELILVGYGMGGRLLSQTQHLADSNQAKWLPSLSRCLYLGKLNEGSLLTFVLRLGGKLVREIPIFFGHAMGNWLEHRGRQLQTESIIQPQAKASFLESKRHMFIDSELSVNDNSSDVTNRHLIPPSAPTHSQNAFLEGISPMQLPHSDRVYALISNWIQDGTAQKIELKHYSAPSLLPIQHVTDKHLASNDSANSLLLAGTLDLVASAYDKTVEALETVHYSIAQEPFYALDKVPVVSLIAKPLEAAQQELLDGLYRDLRSQGKKMHKYAAQIA